MRIANNTILIRAVLFVAAFVAVCEPAFSQDQAATAAETSAENAAKGSGRSVASGALIRVALKERVNWAHVPKASVLEGELSLPLYAGERVLLPEGTAMRVIINSSEKVRAHAGFWRRTGQAIVRAFNPLEKSEASQYQVTLKSAEIQLLSAKTNASRKVEVRANLAAAKHFTDPDSCHPRCRCSANRHFSSKCDGAGLFALRTERFGKPQRR
jgi:hypothetical protein